MAMPVRSAAAAFSYRSWLRSSVRDVTGYLDTDRPHFVIFTSLFPRRILKIL